ncbi:MAG: type II toxin-antitoxin system ParD family antitoxin [Hydrogenophaga sp.]|uniref:type II toxin-antitoxin system ParD family antitoxin n=1 Tax=Hydrogenophaga sp. TaxID=1904254 RepID=UPI0016AA80E8|nr:type II toxin-antitoxin system ParD family antitoxin [Hydrogenophaga sp.]NIM43412.1 type II toxin-antitoxin system ParD family antitoxin [Hydrogenophaga sp.]NIN28481.1 type II toxin-antitoxin system ParD family antitoxin [Hydrogenophaga sp.]NIN32940.1 type II toxin-antitoxin system ParD family antitoxin [Hydrogenophaga sp.]NIN57615.1 type II toxin-antitoxin system ParD family antitoxin [Hydrogenophaga sp.]NIO53910.1 type II toxin-antitoxin system ParD family antitoxin [Hydrogenophaga sp.]
MSMKHTSPPGSVKVSVDKQEQERGHDASDEHVRELVRKDQDRQYLRALLLTGARSAPSRPANAGFFEGLRARVRSQRKKPQALPAASHVGDEP